MTIFMFSVFAILLILGVPIAITLALSAALPLFFFTNVPLVAITQKLFTAVDSFTIMAVPFFVIAGGLLDKGGVSKRLNLQFYLKILFFP